MWSQERNGEHLMSTTELLRKAAVAVALTVLVTTPTAVVTVAGPASADDAVCTKIYGVRVQLAKPGQATTGGAVLKMVNAAHCPKGRFHVRWPGGSKSLRLGPDSEGAARLRLPRLERGDRVTVVYRWAGHVAGRDSVTIGARSS